MASIADQPNRDHAHASFRLVGDALAPERVTTTLGIAPTLARAKGERWGYASGRTYTQRTGVWYVSTEAGSDYAIESSDLEDHLLTLLRIVEPVARPLAKVRAEQGLGADFYCLWMSARGEGGPELSAATLGRIAALDASLGIEFAPLTD